MQLFSGENHSEGRHNKRPQTFESPRVYSRRDRHNNSRNLEKILDFKMKNSEFTLESSEFDLDNLHKKRKSGNLKTLPETSMNLKLIFF